MELESLKLDKFKDSTLKREQLFSLNGGGIKSGGGNISDEHAGRPANYDYGYDSYRNGRLTFHDRSNVVYREIIFLPVEDHPYIPTEDLLP